MQDTSLALTEFPLTIGLEYSPNRVDVAISVGVSSRLLVGPQDGLPIRIIVTQQEELEESYAVDVTWMSSLTLKEILRQRATFLFT